MGAYGEGYSEYSLPPAAHKAHLLVLRDGLDGCDEQREPPQEPVGLEHVAAQAGGRVLRRRPLGTGEFW